jgi:hypothetical protein
MEGVPRVWAYTGVEKNANHLKVKYRLARMFSYPSYNFNTKLLLRSIITTVKDWGLPL